MLFGSLGGASPVRKIDPKTGDVIAVIDPKNRPTSSNDPASDPVHNFLSSVFYVSRGNNVKRL
jgi:hypothetical protein